MIWQKYFAPGYRGNLLALLAGMSLTLAFAPFGLFPLAIFSPAVLLGTWLKVTPQQAFLRGWLYGLGLFGTGIYWIYISVHTYGDANVFLSTLITVGLINIVALFLALTGYLLNHFFQRNDRYKILCAFPIYWVLLEWSRSWLFTGFPWLSIGYSQISSPLKGYAPILGIYGISYAVIVSAALLVDIALHFHNKQKKPMYQSIIILCLIWFFGACFSLIHWTKPFGSPVQVSLVQGNIPQQLRWDPEQIEPTIKHYLDLTRPHWDSKIIVWPEGAIPLPVQSTGKILDNLDAVAKRHGTTFITGIPIKAPEDNVSYYNAIITLGNGEGVYLKRRLVPFGEFTPNNAILKKTLGSLNIPMSDFIPGHAQTEFMTAGDIKISAFICYEIAFPEQVNTSRTDINMLLTVSNDAWFGHSIAQAQHLQMAQMRSLELGRPSLFVSNDGITAIIDAYGKIQASAPPHESYVLTGNVQPYEGQTPWQDSRLDPLLVVMILLLSYALHQRKHAK